MKESLSIFVPKLGRCIECKVHFSILPVFYLFGDSMKDPKVKVSLLYTNSKSCYDSIHFIAIDEGFSVNTISHRNITNKFLL